MTQFKENHVLYRRFLIVTAFIALIGILMAQLIGATHRDAAAFTIHQRALQWEQVIEPDTCVEQECRTDTLEFATV